LSRCPARRLAARVERKLAGRPLRSPRGPPEHWRHIRPITVLRGLARDGHFGWPGGRPSDKERQVSCSSELESMLHQARGEPRRGNAPHPRPSVEVGRRPPAAGVPSGATEAGEVGPSVRASRRVREDRGGGSRPADLTDPGRTTTALRRGHRERGKDDDSTSSPRPSGRGTPTEPDAEPRPGNRYLETGAETRSRTCGNGSRPSGCGRDERQTTPPSAQAVRMAVRPCASDCRDAWSSVRTEAAARTMGTRCAERSGNAAGGNGDSGTALERSTVEIENNTQFAQGKGGTRCPTACTDR
jgi:hypothetical protein